MPHRLLLADDSVTIQRVIELTFAEEGVEVVSVGDGAAAIARLESERFDVVLADVGMPGRDGFDIAAFVRSRPATSGVPVVLLTGALDPLDQVRVAESGAAAVLVKPFEPQMVIAKVRELLGGAPAGPARSAETLQPARTTPASVDDYFDRLDKAFAGLNPSLEPRGSHTEAAPPVAAPPVAAPPGAAVPVVAPPVIDAPAPAPAAPKGSELADTFATLLAVEQGELPPSALLPPAQAGDAELVDRIARRVIEQMGDRAVRELAADIVSRTAERLVREEIDRIKAADPHA
jgi:CheY-like chemotaxis protein